MGQKRKQLFVIIYKINLTMFINKLWKNWTIGTRIGVVLSTGILFSALIICAGINVFFKNEHLATFSKQQFTTVQAYAMYLDGDLANKLKVITAVADAVPADTLLESSAAQQFLSAHTGTQALFDDGLMILSADGILLAEIPFATQDRQDKDYSSYPFFQQARTIGRPVISEPFFSTKPGRRPIIEFMTPIHDDAGKISAYLCGGLTLNGDNALGNIARKKIGDNGFFYIFAKDRTILVHHDPTRTMHKDIPPGANRLFDLALQGFNGSQETINSNGLPLIASFRHLQAAPWILAANTPTHDALAPFRTSQNLVFLTIILSTVGMFLLCWWALFLFMAPLHRLIAHLNEVPSDSGKHDSSPEVRQLCTAFQQQSAKIESGLTELSASKELHHTLLDTTSDIICMKDAHGHWLLANEAMLTLLQLQDIPYQGKIDSDLALYRPLYHDFFLASATSDNQTWELGGILTTEEIICTADNIARIFEVTRTPIFHPDGRRKTLVIIGRDITARKSNEESIRKLSRAVEQSPVSIIITDAQGNIEFVNPHFTRLTGYTKEEILGRNPRVLKTNLNPPETYAKLWKTISSGKVWEGEFCNKKKNGELFTEHAIISPILNDAGEITHYIGIKEDITARKQSEETIWRQSNFDSLTQLPNRRLFLYRLENAIPYTKRDTSSLALLLLNLDHFKEINDTLGHDYGDLLLIEAAQRIQSCVRETDTVARFGGDEFILLLTNIQINISVDKVAGKIIAALNQPFFLNNEIVHISASIGVTICPEDSIFVSTLLQNANRAMYQAKKDGRNYWKSYTQVQQEAAQKEQHVEI